MRLAIFMALAGLACASPGRAGDAIAIDRTVHVERISGGIRALEPASRLKSGDRVVLTIAWRGALPSRATVVQSAVPRTLAFQRAANDAVEVSIDGGRQWGELGALRIGNRLASAEDVTHVRMKVAGTPAGRMSFSAIVR